MTFSALQVGFSVVPCCTPRTPPSRVYSSAHRRGDGPALRCSRRQVPQTTSVDFATLRMIVVGIERRSRARPRAVWSRRSLRCGCTRCRSTRSARGGGLLGRVDVTTLRAEVQRALTGLRIGQTSAVVPIATGFAVLQIVSGLGVASAASTLPAWRRSVPWAAKVRARYRRSAGSRGGAARVPGRLTTGTWTRAPSARCGGRDSLSTSTQLFEEFFSPAAENLEKDAHAVRVDAGASRPPVARVSGHAAACCGALRAGARTRAGWCLWRLAAGGGNGVAYLHRIGRMDNGVFRQPEDRCLIPTGTGTRLRRPPTWTKAVAMFTSYRETGRTTTRFAGC